jgi:uncharacterized protein GlcG (DUF336 family)
VTSLNLKDANTIIEAALAKAREASLKPLSVAVLDAGGHLVAFQKQDGSSMLRFEIAFGKAYGALAVGSGSRWLNNAAIERPHFVQALSGASGGRIVPVPGGVLVRSGSGAVLGAVGISGDTSDNDELCGVAGITAAGLGADAG